MSAEHQPSVAETGESYLLLETPIGQCGLAWSERGLVRLQLPDTSREATERRIASRNRTRATVPLPARLAADVDLLRAYFAGAAVDLCPIVVDLGHCPDFHREIYAECRRIPWGETSTYGALAGRVGAPGAARGVGQAMARNPVPVVVPCHRVLASGQAWGGFSAPGGLTTKQRLLDLEEASAIDKLPLFAPR